MDINKEREAFEDWYCKNHTGLKQSDLAKFRTLSDYSFSDSLKINISWEAWQAAKAQAVPEWINVNLLSPQVDTEVLVCVGDDVKTAIYRDLDGEGYFEGVFGAKWWMPKPKAQEPAND